MKGPGRAAPSARVTFRALYLNISDKTLTKPTAPDVVDVLGHVVGDAEDVEEAKTS